MTMPDSTTIAISDLVMLWINYQSGNVSFYSLNGNDWTLQQSFSRFRLTYFYNTKNWVNAADL